MRASGIESLVGTLALRNPDALDEIAASHPDHRNLLAPGAVLEFGASKSKFEGDPAVLMAIAKAALAEFSPLIEEAIDHLHKKINRTNWITLGGQVISVVGSGGSVLLLLKKITDMIGTTPAEGVALISFIGAATSLYIKGLRRDFIGAENGTVKQYIALRDAAWEARVYLAQLESINEKQTPFKKDETRIVDDANKLAQRVHQLLRDVGLPMKCRERRVS